MRIFREIETPFKEIDLILWSLWHSAHKKTLTEKEFKSLVPAYENDADMRNFLYNHWVISGTFPRDNSDFHFIYKPNQWEKVNFQRFTYILTSSMKYFHIKIHEFDQMKSDPATDINYQIYLSLIRNSINYIESKILEFISNE